MLEQLIVAPGSVAADGRPLALSPIVPERAAAISIAVPSRPERLAWLVPGLVLGLPGAVLIIVVTAQVVGAATFLRLTHRTLGSFGLAPAKTVD